MKRLLGAVAGAFVLALIAAAPGASATVLESRFGKDGHLERLAQSLEGGKVRRLTTISPEGRRTVSQWRGGRPESLVIDERPTGGGSTLYTEPLPDSVASKVFSEHLSESAFLRKQVSRTEGATTVRVAYRRAGEGAFIEESRVSIPIEIQDNGAWPRDQAASAKSSAAGAAPGASDGR